MVDWGISWCRQWAACWSSELLLLQAWSCLSVFKRQFCYVLSCVLAAVVARGRHMDTLEFSYIQKCPMSSLTMALTSFQASLWVRWFPWVWSWLYHQDHDTKYGRYGQFASREGYRQQWKGVEYLDGTNRTSNAQGSYEVHQLSTKIHPYSLIYWSVAGYDTEGGKR